MTKLISTTEAARYLNLTRTRINVLAKQGRIAGVIRIGRQYAYPYPPKILPPLKNSA